MKKVNNPHKQKHLDKKQGEAPRLSRPSREVVQEKGRKVVKSKKK